MANVNVKVGYTIDKTGLNELKKQLTDIRVEAANAKLAGRLTEDLEKASIAAGKLEDALDISWNSKLNQLNLSKFQDTIKKAGTTVDQLMTSLSKGPASANLAFENLTRNIATTNLQLKTSSKLLDSFAVTFKNTVRYGISSSIFNNLSNSIKKAYDYTKDLDTSLTDIRIVSDKTAVDMERFAINANKAAKSLGRSTLDYTRASTIYYQQGLSDEEVKARTEVTLKAANVTGQASAEVSEQLTSIWNGYKVTADEAELYIDKVAAVAAATAADLEELSTGMSKVASAANLMGVDIDQLNAQLATIVSVTRQAPESVGVALKTIYARMSDIEAGLDEETTLGNYTEKMAQYGINVLNANGQLRDMGEVIEEIGGKWTSMSREQQVALSQIMAGTRQYNNLLSLFDNWEMYTKSLKVSQESAGALQEQQDIYMESTEAHLKQMRAEAERTYDIIFNQDTVNGFADALTGALKQFNDYISGIGGGMNALLSLGAQVANLYRKQIGEALVRQADNLKKYWDENKRGVEVIQSLRETVQRAREESLAKQMSSNGKTYEVEYSDAYKQNTDEVLDTVEKAYQVRKGLTDVQINEIQNEAQLLAQLKDEEAYYESIRKYAEQEYSIVDSVDAKQGVEAETRSLEYLSSIYTKIKTTNEEIAELHVKAGITTGDIAAIEDAENQKRLTAQQAINSLIKSETLSETQLLQLEQMKNTLKDGEVLDENQLNQLSDIKINLAVQHNNQLKENQAILEAILRDENRITKEKRKQILGIQANINNTLETGKRNAIATTGVQYASAAIEGLTALTGALSAFGKANATGAEKANAAWQGVFGVGSAVANAILPGSGFIVQGLGAVGKGILEATGLWGDFEDHFKSTKEKLEELNEEMAKFKELQKQAASDIKDKNSALEYFKTIGERFEYLQDLAKKGLLTQDLRTEYEGYLEKVQQYTDDIIISYDKQGNMITNNTNAIQKTIDKLQEENKILLSQTYGGDSWKEYAEQQEKDFNDKQKLWEKTQDKYYKNLHDRTREHDMYGNSIALSWGIRDFANNRDTDTLLSFANSDNQNAKNFSKLFTESDKWEEQMHNPEEWKKQAEKYVDDYIQWLEDNDYIDWFNKKSKENNLKGLQSYIDRYYEELLNIRSNYENDKASTIGSQSVDLSYILNNLMFDPSQNGSYQNLSKQLGEDTMNQILESYMNGIDVSSSKFKDKKGKLQYDKIRSNVKDFQTELIALFQTQNGDALKAQLKDILENTDMVGLTSQEYEDIMISKIEKFLEQIDSEEQFNKIKSYLPSMFGLKDVSAQWKDDKAQLGYNGGNIVTSGEGMARSIGQSLSGLNYSSFSGDRTVLAGNIEQYLQNSLSETNLQNLDTATFANKFIEYLNQEIKLAGENGETVDIEGVLNRTLKSMNLNPDEEGGLSTASKQRAKELEYTTEALEGYTKKLQETNPVLKENQKLTEQVALAQMDLAHDLKTVVKNWDTWEKDLEKVDKGTADYYKTLGEMAEAMGDVFNIPVSTKFIEDNLADLRKMVDGDVEAFERLQVAAAKDYVANLSINANTERIDEVRNELNAFIDEYSGRDIGFTASIDDSPFVQSLNKMIENGELTEKQVNEYLAGIGYEGEVGYKEGPETETVSEVSGNILGKDFKIGTVKTKTKTQVPYLKSITKTSDRGTRASTFKSATTGSNARPGSKGSGGGGGGSSKEPDTMDAIEDEKDRYHDVNVELDLISKDLDKLDKQKKKLFGQGLINNLNKRLNLLNKQIDTTNEKIKIAQRETQELQSKLSGKGVAFNADGTIANYAQAYASQLNYVNGLINQYNHMSAAAQEGFKDTVEKAKEDFNKFVENIERYDELITDMIPGLEADIQAAVDEKIDLQIEKFDMEIELRLNLAEAERDWNEFKKRIIDGIEDDDILGNAMARLVDFSSYYKEDNTGIVQALRKQVDNTLAELNQMDTNGWSNVYGDNRTAALDDLKKYYEELMSNLTDVLELQKEIHESYIDMMDEAQEKFDEQIEAYEMISDLIEHDMEVISLVYGEQSYGQLAKYYDKQQQNFNSQLDFQRQQADFWRQQLDTLEEGSDEWENAREKWADAVQSMNDLIEESIQNLQDKYLNAINLIFQNLNNKITDNLGLEYIEEEWNLINKNADRYLDTINSLYEVQKLEGKYLDALDQTDSISAQRQLKKIMDEELADLREKDKLTQYDIERANKKYEIALKQIALQEAQQNKSKMRLRRDSQGNYRYEYTADGDQVGQLQDELNDMYNSLYNFDKAKYQDNLNQMYDVWVEFQEKMAEAAQISDPVKRSERELLLQTQYEQLINSLTNQNATIRENLEESVFNDLAELYDIDISNFQEMTDEEKDILMGELLPYWDSGLQHMTDAFAGEDGFLGVCKDAFDQLHEATKDYEDGLSELETTGELSFESIGEGIDENIDRTQQLISNNTELINSYEQELTAINNVIAQLDNLVNKYNAAKEAAIAATKAAYEYWSEQQRQAAAAAGNANGGSGSGNGNSGSGSGSSGSGAGGGSALGGDNNLVVGETATYSGKYYYDSYGSSPTGSKYSGVANGIVVDRITNNPYGIHIHSADGRYRDLGWVKKSQLSGYDTGGYTGEWGSDGRLALLHQKELVLNKEDTANMLNAISIMRNITNMLGSSVLGKLAAATAGGLGTEVGGDVLEQNVHIDAQFPNVKDSREIEEALNNLVNMASMRANRR